MFYLGSRVKKDRSLEVISPYDGKIVERVGISEADDIQRAIETARLGNEKLKRLPTGERAAILRRSGEIIGKRREEFARTLALEVGKTIKEARGEVDRCINTLNLSAIAAMELSGETVNFDLFGKSRKVGFYKRVPVGITVAISPFNFPLNLVAHKLGPSVAAGNGIILKPASKTPLSGIMLAEVLVEAGLPKEAITVLIGSGREIGEPLVSHPEVRLVTFTGSLEVGKRIAHLAGLKKLVMELGSNSGVIIWKDGDLSRAAKRIRLGGYALAGQVCISVQRVYVEESVAAEFLEIFQKEVESIRFGDPLREETEMGPMITEDAARNAEGLVAEAVEMGGELKTGGRRNFTMFEPTILFNVPEDARVMREEAFAPIVVVNPVRSLDEAITRMNNSVYGLQAGVYTRDLGVAFRCLEELDAGGVLINEIPTFRVDNMPYGGMKGSGLGREGPKFAIEEHTEIKLMIIDR
ncbi:aldehyde dehydrogenase [candidate division WOR-3 bacterium]|uniref:Aldehyde dehydrogenase n=1 Tax=candidate division WOR-3 bacterium TaxID=2052148 RepID=A0A660SMV6_UNCW3|nr:MAG: aldehyde dehydrogenase [candidate division WOR-3 bacterium]